MQKHDYCHVKMPKEFNKILTYNQEQNSLKTTFVIYADTKSLLEKVHVCQNNLERAFTSKIDKHIVCGHSIFMQGSFDATKINITSEVFLLEEKNNNNKDNHISKRLSVLTTNHKLPTKRTL